MTVKHLPVFNHNNLGDCFRQLSGMVEDGSIKAVRAVVVLELESVDVDYRAVGEKFTAMHGAGLCFAAAAEITKN